MVFAQKGYWKQTVFLLGLNFPLFLILMAPGQGGTNIIEDLVFNLGHNQTQRGEGSMGVIYRVTRTERHHFPTNGTIDQCFHYVCAIKAPEGL